jgi:hypothetical protein
MNKRQLALPYLVKNYKQWPAKADSPGAVSHHGYNWRKIESAGPWVMVNQFGDVITKADYIKEYEDNVKMSDLFGTALGCQGIVRAPLDPDDDVTTTFTCAQFRAMCVAVRRYDGMRAKLEHARKSARRLSEELT